MFSDDLNPMKTHWNRLREPRVFAANVLCAATVFRGVFDHLMESSRSVWCDVRGVFSHGVYKPL